MAVKLEVIIYTDENSTLRVRSMGLLIKKDLRMKRSG